MLILVTAPAEANMVARGTGVGGVAYSLKKNLGELTDQLGEMTAAVIEGDDEQAKPGKRSRRHRERSSMRSPS